MKELELSYMGSQFDAWEDTTNGYMMGSNDGEFYHDTMMLLKVSRRDMEKDAMISMQLGERAGCGQRKYK